MKPMSSSRAGTTRRRWTVGALSIALVLVVGCGDQSTNGEDAATEDGEPVTDAPADEETSEDTGQSDEPIVLGAFYDLTGPLAVTGGEGRRGAELAVDVINRDGGVLGRQLELRVTDSACDAATGLSAVRRLIDDPDLFAMVGGSCSPVVLSLKELMDEEGIPHIVGSAAASEIAEPPSRYVFMSTMPTRLEAEATAELVINDLDPESVAVVALANDYGRSALRAVGEVFEQNNKSDLLTEVIDVPLESTDYRQQMLLLERADPDVTIVAVTDITAVLRQAEQIGVDTQWVTFAAGTIRPTIQPLSEAGLLEGVTTTYYGPEIIATNAEAEGMRRFVEEFESEHGEFPSTMEIIGWNTIHILRDGLELAGEVDREALVDALETQTLDYGTTFPYDFSAGNRAGLTRMSLMTYGDTAPDEFGLYGNAVIE